MRRSLFVIPFVAPLLFAAPAFAQYSPDAVAKIREEINLNNARAHQLDPIIARDTQARNDTASDAGQLEQEARAMHGRSQQFRGVASTLPPGPQQQQLNQTASELDTYAVHNEQLAASQRDLSNRLSGVINLMVEGRNQHLAQAARLQAMISGGGF